MSGPGLDGYRIVDALGEGGMGAVYRAIDLMLEREVALKFLRPELANRPEIVERFRTEAVTLARLQHPGIATLYGLVRSGEQLVMVMEYVRGETLEALVKRDGRLSPSRAVTLCAEVLQALAYAHEAGIVHRDVKPANVMVASQGSTKMMDFGIARVLGADRRTKYGHMIGTVAYMSPEQVKGSEIDGRTDLYSLGIVLYELLTGRVPFTSNSDYAVMHAQVHEEPPAPRSFVSVPEALEEVILRALAKQPAARYGSAQEFRAALLSSIPALLLDPHENGPRPTRVITFPQSSWRVSMAAGALAMALVAAPVFWWIESRQAPIDTESSTSGLPDPITEPAVVTPPGALPPATPPAGLPQGAKPPADTRPAETRPADIPSAGVPFPSGPTLPFSGDMPSGSSPARVERATAAQQSPTRNERVPEPVVVQRQPGVAASPNRLPSPITEAPAPTAPTVPVARTETPASAPVTSPAVFDAVRILVTKDSKSREVDARLTLGTDAVSVEDPKSGSLLKTLRYADIRGATYAQSKHPRWKEGAGAAVAIGVLATPVFFLKSTKHWLTFQTGNDFAVLRLDKNNYRLIIPAFETRSRIQIDIEGPN